MLKKIADVMGSNDGPWLVAYVKRLFDLNYKEYMAARSEIPDGSKSRVVKQVAIGSVTLFSIIGAGVGAIFPAYLAVTLIAHIVVKVLFG